MEVIGRSATHSDVLLAAARAYELEGLEAVVGTPEAAKANGSALPDLLIPALRRVEEIETDETFENMDPVWYRALRDRGLEVWVVVPLHLVGRAQTKLTDCADRLQPWWEEEGRVRFGNPRHL